MRKLILSLMIVLMITAGSGGWRYYAYITNTTSPYDEVGITLNQYMPDAVRDWGCAKLHKTFGDAVPPLGCATDADPTKWRS